MATCINSCGGWLWRKGTCINTIVDDGYGGSILVDNGYLYQYQWRKATCINTSGGWLPVSILVEDGYLYQYQQRMATCINTSEGWLPVSILVEDGYLCQYQWRMATGINNSGRWLWRKGTCINTIVDDGYGGRLPESILVEDGYGGRLPVLVDDSYLQQFQQRLATCINVG